MLRSLVPVVAVLAAPALDSLCAQSVYDFNVLNGSDTHPYTLLDGQDNWSEETFNARNRCGVTATLSHDGTPSLRFQEVGPGYGCDASRINNASWSFPAFTGSETAAWFEADMLVGFWGGSFGLAHDVDLDGRIRGSQPGERGVRFTIGTQANVQLRLHAADGTFVRAPLAPLGISGGNWVRIRVLMDFTDGGRGSLQVRNISAGATSWTVVPELTGVPLGLDPTATDAKNPTLWDAMWLHFEGATYGMDNVAIGSGGLAWAVPYGTGCGATPLGLRSGNAPVLGQTASAETFDMPSNAQGGILLFGLVDVVPGFDLGAIGMPGCELRLVSATSLAFAVGSSTATHPVPLPNDPALAGGSIFLQSAVIAPGENALGVIASNGLRWVLDLQ